MGFFFTRQEEKIGKEIIREERQAAAKQSEVNKLKGQAAKGCEGCTLNDARLQNPKMLPTGSKDPILYILGEAPGQEEDEEGEQFIGKAGRYLRRRLPEKYLKYTRWNNTIRCRPTQGKANRKPTKLEVECCRRLQVADIEQTKPKAIFGFGLVPYEWLTGKGVSMGIWRGRRMPVRIGTHECWYYVLMHPSYMIRQENMHRRRMTDPLEMVFELDLKRALHEVFEDELPDPVVEDPDNYDQGVSLLLKPTLKEVQAVLDEALEWDEVGIDYETNAYRPYFKERRVLTLAISNYDTTYAIPYMHPGFDWGSDLPKVRKAIRNFLLKSKKKIAHNLAFEMEWTAEEFGEDLLWETAWGDTMAMAYVLDERKGGKELEDLTLLHLGFDVKALSNVKAKRLQYEPLEKVLKYNAYDPKYTFAVAQFMEARLRADDLWDVYEQRVRRTAPLVIAQRRGMVPNIEEAEKLRKVWQGKADVVEAKISKNKDVVTYIQEGNPFSVTSNTKLLDFFQHQGYNIGNVDESVLGEIRHPTAKMILEHRGIMKNLSTYILPMCKGGKNIHEDGLVHTRYKHLVTSTNRLSSEDPNLQNFPKRKHKEIRIVLRGPNGYWIVCIDYGQIEARVIAMASLDKVLIASLYENYDVHSEWASILARTLKLKDVIDDEKTKSTGAFKAYRNVIKNGWTFPLFFGSSLASVAGNLSTTEAKIAKHYDKFWETFSGVHDWQQDLNKFYDKHGYVETLTGFRRRMPMTWNELINEPIQGTACDIVMDGMCRVSELAYAKDLDFLQPRMNVHDDLTYAFPEARLEEGIELAAKEMCSCDFPFINVPLTVEVTVGPNWYEQEEVMVYDSRQFGYPRIA